MEYKLGTPADLDKICDLINRAVENMEAHGIHQWDDIYPVRDDFAEDIMKQTLYIL